MTTTLRWLESHTSLISIAGDEACCVNCKHFVQHYIRSNLQSGAFIPVTLGHCTHPTIKTRRAHQVCNCFENKQSGSE